MYIFKIIDIFLDKIKFIFVNWKYLKNVNWKKWIICLNIGKWYNLIGLLDLVVFGNVFNWICGMYILFGNNIFGVVFRRNNNLVVVIGYKILFVLFKV